MKTKNPSRWPPGTVQRIGEAIDNRAEHFLAGLSRPGAMPATWSKAFQRAYYAVQRSRKPELFREPWAPAVDRSCRAVAQVAYYSFPCWHVTAYRILERLNGPPLKPRIVTSKRPRDPWGRAFTDSRIKLVGLARKEGWGRRASLQTDHIVAKTA